MTWNIDGMAYMPVTGDGLTSAKQTSLMRGLSLVHQELLVPGQSDLPIL